MKVGYKILLLYMQYFLRYKQMKIAKFARAHTKSGILFSGHVLMIKVDDCPYKYSHKKSFKNLQK